MTLNTELLKLMETEYKWAMEQNSLQKAVQILHKRGQQSQSGIPELQELREITQDELGRLEALVKDYSEVRRDLYILTDRIARKVLRLYPQYAFDGIRYDISNIYARDLPVFGGFRDEISSEGYLVVVAFGSPNNEYPHLQFDNHTLLGWLETDFHPSNVDDMPYRHPGKLGFKVSTDLVYVPPEFRRRGISNQLRYAMEFVLRKYGYGNIEVKAENPLLMPSLEKDGYKYSGVDCIWGKIL